MISAKVLHFHENAKRFRKKIRISPDFPDIPDYPGILKTLENV